MELLCKVHGKGPADGMGGAVKRLAAEASLQTVYSNQIQTSPELFNYCSSNTYNIISLYVQEWQLLTIKRNLQYYLISQLQYQELEFITVSRYWTPGQSLQLRLLCPHLS
jgi:hypothetical protein